MNFTSLVWALHDKCKSLHHKINASSRAKKQLVTCKPVTCNSLQAINNTSSNHPTVTPVPAQPSSNSHPNVPRYPGSGNIPSTNHTPPPTPAPAHPCSDANTLPPCPNLTCTRLESAPPFHILPQTGLLPNEAVPSYPTRFR